MKMSTIASLGMCMTLAVPMSANAGVKDDIVTLSGFVNAGLCAYRPRDPSIAIGCDEEFIGWYGASEKKYTNDRVEPDCKPKSQFPIESADCNVTGSKAEWRHDTLRGLLDATHRKLDKGNIDGANRRICAFVAKVKKMYQAGRIDHDGRTILVPPAKKIARKIGMSCADLEEAEVGDLGG